MCMSLTPLLADASDDLILICEAILVGLGAAFVAFAVSHYINRIKVQC